MSLQVADSVSKVKTLPRTVQEVWSKRQSMLADPRNDDLEIRTAVQTQTAKPHTGVRSAQVLAIVIVSGSAVFVVLTCLYFSIRLSRHIRSSVISLLLCDCSTSKNSDVRSMKSTRVTSP
mmetsp:Transcript_30181/g.89556  ORF Transcript_30181/g.89556 Transcript_30181/m.89556 type:complete len:120 (+) Transcript_30181:1672-2031(+)